MATNPYVNKVEYGGTTLIDITDTTAEDADVAEGKVYYKASGLRSVGTASGGGGNTDPYPVRNDGKTHLWFYTQLPNSEVTFYCGLTGSPHEAVIDWGDGASGRLGPGIAASEYFTNTHVYADSGVHEATITTVSGECLLGSSKSSESIMGGNSWNINGHSSIANRKYLVAVEVPQNARTYGPAISGLVCLTKATLPAEDTVELTAYFARYCYSLREIVLPPNISSIKSGAFQACSSVEKLILPSTLTSVASNAFAYMYSMRELHFKSTTPPTVSAASAFLALPKTCVIYVPTGTLADYQAAGNYPDPATYTYVEE